MYKVDYFTKNGIIYVSLIAVQMPGGLSCCMFVKCSLVDAYIHHHVRSMYFKTLLECLSRYCPETKNISSSTRASNRGSKSYGQVSTY